MSDEAEVDAAVQAGLVLARELGALLAGRSGIVQGAALADLLAMWIAGHSPALREGVLQEHVKVVRKLVPVNARAIAQRHNLPQWITQ